MPVDDLYWNSIDFGSEEEEEESLQDVPAAKPYIDPWDLENYAYIREHLDSMELSSDPCSSGEFAAEANSTSFYYVPGNVQKDQGNYVAIDEVRGYDRGRPRSEQVYSDSGLSRMPARGEFDSEFEENPYEENHKDSSLFYPCESRDRRKRMTTASGHKTPRDRSLSFSYGDSYGYDSYGTKQEIYTRLEEVQTKESIRPVPGNPKNVRRQPRNFGLSNYGHLKIDYSYSWNNLDKYICN